MSLLDRFRTAPTTSPTPETTYMTTDPTPPAAPTAVPDPPAPPTPPSSPDLAALAAENAALRAEIHDRRMAELLAEAGGMARLADPADVLRFVDRGELLDADGNPSPDKITAAASRLAAERPYLRATSAPAPGSANGGPQGPGMARLSLADLDRLGPGEIERARRMGLLDHLLIQ